MKVVVEVGTVITFDRWLDWLDEEGIKPYFIRGTSCVATGPVTWNQTWESGRGWCLEVIVID